MWIRLFIVLVFLTLLPATSPALAQQVPVRALGRFDGWRQNALVGYGIVTGLAGSGDSRNSVMTRQALHNTLSRLGTSVMPMDISSRNVAVVVVTAMLPASANVGDQIDVTVSSIGDARSIAGGTLLMTSLVGPDRQTYALAQGQLVVGGYQFDAQLNLAQRNYPTSGRIVRGATIERSVDAMLVNSRGEVAFLLAEPDFDTAQGIANAISAKFGPGLARAENADRVIITAPSDRPGLIALIAAIGALEVKPARQYRVVVNERTGTVVAGGNVTISPVVISQGDIKVAVETYREGVQPLILSGLANDSPGLIISNTKLSVEQGRNDATIKLGSTTIADLIQGLAAMKVDTRRMISILQALKSAGALQAEIVIE